MCFLPVQRGKLRFLPNHLLPGSNHLFTPRWHWISPFYFLHVCDGSSEVLEALSCLPVWVQIFPVCLEKKSQIVSWGQTPLARASQNEGSAGRPIIHDPAVPPPHPFLLLLTRMGLNVSLLCCKKSSSLCSLLSCPTGSQLSHSTWCLLFPFSKMPQSYFHTESKRSHSLSRSTFILFVHLIQKKCWAPVIFQIYYSQWWGTASDNF